MSEDQENQQQKQNTKVSQEHPQFNYGSSQKTQVQDSLVPDLMKVYESMTQSSTPQEEVVTAPASVGDQPTYPVHSLNQEQQISQPQTAQGSYEIYQQYQQVPVPVQHSKQESYCNPSTQEHEFYPPPPSTSHQDQALLTQVPPAPPYPPSSSSASPLATSQKPAAPSAKKSGRPLRKRTSDKNSETREKPAKNRKKSNNLDNRWSKRFTWPDDLHRDFVSAIFDVGLKHSSPSAILEHMPAHEQITSERIKSHLQKYRLHRTKSKKDFMSSYDASLKKFRSGGVDRNSSLSDGQVAAHLSFSTITEADATVDTGSICQGNDEKLALAQNSERTKELNNQLNKLILPQLTEEEKRSPIGTSLGYLTGLFFSLNQQLMNQRAAKAGVDATSVKSPGDYPSNGAQNQNAMKLPSTSQASGYATSSYENYQPQAKENSWHPPTSHDGGQIPQKVKHQEQPVENDEKAHASTRTNYEENKLMKKEMENQMFFQNKMRDLKQRELNKYKPTQEQPNENNNNDAKAATIAPHHIYSAKKKEEGGISTKDSDSAINRSHGPGENAETNEQGATSERSRGISIGATDEFWNTDVVDEQLFEFLMNP